MSFHLSPLALVNITPTRLPSADKAITAETPFLVLTGSLLPTDCSNFLDGYFNISESFPYFNHEVIYNREVLLIENLVEAEN